MREIEIKAQVAELDSIRTVLLEQGVQLSEPVAHHDVVWGLKGVKSGLGMPWLRLRTETKGGKQRYLFTFKRSVTGQLDSIEHETEVSEPGEITAIVQELGFELYSDITKTRQKAQLGDIELCLDSVDGLGDFIEAEKLTDESATLEDVTAELWAVLEGLGVGRDNTITDGYDVLVNRKLGKE